MLQEGMTGMKLLKSTFSTSWEAWDVNGFLGALTGSVAVSGRRLAYVARTRDV